MGNVNPRNEKIPRTTYLSLLYKKAPSQVYGNIRLIIAHHTHERTRVPTGDVCKSRQGLEFLKYGVFKYSFYYFIFCTRIPF